MKRANRILALATRHIPKDKQRTPGDAFGLWQNRDPLGIWDALPWKGEPEKPEPTPAEQIQDEKRELLENRSIGSKVTRSLPKLNFGDWGR